MLASQYLIKDLPHPPRVPLAVLDERTRARLAARVAHARREHIELRPVLRKHGLRLARHYAEPRFQLLQERIRLPERQAVPGRNEPVAYYYVERGGRIARQKLRHLTPVQELLVLHDELDVHYAAPAVLDVPASLFRTQLAPRAPAHRPHRVRELGLFPRPCQDPEPHLLESLAYTGVPGYRAPARQRLQLPDRRAFGIILLERLRRLREHAFGAAGPQARVHAEYVSLLRHRGEQEYHPLREPRVELLAADLRHAAALARVLVYE